MIVQSHDCLLDTTSVPNRNDPKLLEIFRSETGQKVNGNSILKEGCGVLFEIQLAEPFHDVHRPSDGRDAFPGSAFTGCLSSEPQPSGDW